MNRKLFFILSPCLTDAYLHIPPNKCRIYHPTYCIMDDNGTNDSNNHMQKQMEDMLMTTTSIMTANNDAI